jgi:hypothetical protein
MSTDFQSGTSTLQPSVGAAVYSSDGDQFAYVKDVRGGYFKVDVPMSPDYWLSAQYIDHVSPEEVHLRISRDEVDEHHLEEPGLDPTTDPHQDTSDKILSDEEALTQRERMERELELQRQRMFKERGEDVGMR